MHKVIEWFQQQLGLPELVLDSDRLSGKRIYATYLQQMGFELEHEDCFKDYQLLMQKED